MSQQGDAITRTSEANETARRRRQSQKYVTRACDSCKRRKSKCDGEDPCSRCLKQGTICAYQSPYNRIKHRGVRSQSMAAHSPMTQPRDVVNGSITHIPEGATNFIPPVVNGSEFDNATGPGIHLEDEEPDDASNLNFVRRVYKHLSLVTSSENFPRALNSEEGGEIQRSLDMTTFIAPSQEAATEYYRCYFEHASVTYRYIDRLIAENLLAQYYASDDEISEDHSSVALVLTIMAQGCIWMPSWKGTSFTSAKKIANKLLRAAQLRLEKASTMFPPALSTIQAHVLATQLQLATSRFNSAWMSLGAAIRLTQITDLHKDTKNLSPRAAYVKRGLFWTIFILDRYMSVVFGRPLTISEDDITQGYPSAFDTGRHEYGKTESQLVPGVVAHIKLVRIAGRIMQRLYGNKRSKSAKDRDAVVAELEQDLERWKIETPVFFQPESEPHKGQDLPFYNVAWIFQRQQKTIRAAFQYTTVLLYRGYLLQEVLQKATVAPSGEVFQSSQISAQARKCLDAALKTSEFAAQIGDDPSYNAVYWTTSYFTFCSIAVLLVYLTFNLDAPDYKEIERIVDKAMKGHRRLCHDESSQARRVLEESRDIVSAVQQGETPTSLRNDHGNAHALDLPYPPANHGETGGNQFFPNFDDQNQIPVDSVLDNEFFRELYQSGTFGDGSGLDIIMNAGFDGGWVV
ncbi:fungal-specific transcription factor domain-containing protein [Cadophora sp. MPI-SDFR-AT-0126]|nr:fungal-specific transcription factor domain-containing protein [Leotiomycetes sp. MPI-SDFR-AT-0126]